MNKVKQQFTDSVVGYCKWCGKSFYIFYFEKQEPLVIKSCDCRSKEPKVNAGVQK